MLSAKFYNALGKFFYLPRDFAVLPFRWNPTTRQLNVSRKGKHYFLLYGSTLFYTFQLTQILPLIFGLRGKAFEAGPEETVIQCLYATACLAFGIFNCVILKRKHSICNMLNQCFEFDTMQTGRGWSEESNMWDEMYWSVRVANKIPRTFAFLFTCLTFYRQRDRRYCLCPFAAEPKRMNPGKLLFWLIAEFFQSYSMSSVFVFFMYLLHICCSVYTYWLRRLQRRIKLTSKPANKRFTTDEIQACLKTYQILQLLNKQFNSCMQFEAMPAWMCLNFTNHMLSLYFTVNGLGRIPWAGYFGFPLLSFNWIVIELLIYSRIGNVRQKSQSVLQTWKVCSCDYLCEKMASQKESKRWRSLRPLGIACGSYYVMKPETSLYVIMGVSSCVKNISLIE